jgi:hypothetical protein
LPHCVRCAQVHGLSFLAFTLALGLLTLGKGSMPYRYRFASEAMFKSSDTGREGRESKVQHRY